MRLFSSRFRLGEVGGKWPEQPTSRIVAAGFRPVKVDRLNPQKRKRFQEEEKVSETFFRP
jgi:hypothetical protein